MAKKITAKQIEEAIFAAWSDIWWIPQCRVGCGWGADGERTMDMWGINSKRPFSHYAIEIKVSKGDFRRDLKNSLKQRRARLFANEFYYATPEGLLDKTNLPEWAGLIIADGYGGINIEVPAPHFDSSPPTWSFVANLVRRFLREQRQTPIVHERPSLHDSGGRGGL